MSPVSPPAPAGRTPILRSLSPALAVVLITLVVIACFWSLLGSPGSFPASTGAASSQLTLIDGLAQLEDYRTDGRLSFLSDLDSGANRSAARGHVITHPLFFTLSHFLPAGWSLTLLVSLHVAVGAIAMLFLLRRLTPGLPTAIYGALVFFLAGQLLNAGADRASELGLSLSATLVPVLVLAGLGALCRPGWQSAVGLATAVASLALVGDLVGLGFALAASSLGVIACLRLDPSRRIAPGAALSTGLALLWGLSLGAYRWLPALAEAPASSAWLESLRAPWWQADSSIRLPFHLGAVTLITLALSVRNLTRRSAGKWILPIFALGATAALFGPPAVLPFLGFFLALGMIAAFESLTGPRSPRVRNALATLALALLVFEALPVHRETLRGRTENELAGSPAWLEHLARYPATGRVAVLGQAPAEHEAALALKGRRSWKRSARYLDINHVPDPHELVDQNVRYLVSDVPDWQRRYVLLGRVREDGKYLFRNPRWAGPVWWEREELTRTDVGREASALASPAPLPGEDRLLGWGRSGDRLRLSVRLKAPARVFVDRPAHPGWSATSSDTRLPLESAPGDSRLSFQLPAGQSEVILEFRPPALEAGLVFSCLGLLAMPFVIITPVLRRRLARPRAHYAPSQHRVVRRKRVRRQPSVEETPVLTPPVPREAGEEVEAERHPRPSMPVEV